ncbi:MAG: glycosyltransferase [archaeon]
MNKSIDIVLPVYNEEELLEYNTLKLHTHLSSFFKDYNWKIIIAENGSNDQTFRIAKKLCKKYSNISCFHLKTKGRGFALRNAWTDSKADIVCYMDIDLSTDLSHLKDLISSVGAKYTAATGSRLSNLSKVSRPIYRSFLSKSYNFLVRLILKTKIMDLGCGFKAAKRELIVPLFKSVKSNDWFFDAELFLLIEKKEYSIKQIPVKWMHGAKSKVKLTSIISEYMKSIIRMRIMGY